MGQVESLPRLGLQPGSPAHFVVGDPAVEVVRPAREKHRKRTDVFSAGGAATCVGLGRSLSVCTRPKTEV